MSTPEHSRQVRPWELLDERPRTDGWVPVTTRTYRMPDGSVSEWDIHTIPFTTVGVLALTDDDRVVLTRQFRPGPSEIVLDLPGGIVDPGETVLDAAVRELREETGYGFGSVEPAGSCWAFGASTWRRHVAVARGCRPETTPVSWGGDEYCEPVVVSVAEVRRIAREGRSTDVDLLYLALDAAGLL